MADNEVITWLLCHRSRWAGWPTRPVTLCSTTSREIEQEYFARRDRLVRMGCPSVDVDAVDRAIADARTQWRRDYRRRVEQCL